MKSKNIKFEKCSEKDDAIYLRKNNNYFDKIIAKKYKENLEQKNILIKKYYHIV